MPEIERAFVKLYCHPELKDVAQVLANNLKIDLTELATRALAKYCRRLDLSDVPRNARGPKPRKASPAAPAAPGQKRKEKTK